MRLGSSRDVQVGNRMWCGKLYESFFAFVSFKYRLQIFLSLRSLSSSSLSQHFTQVDLRGLLCIAHQICLRSSHKRFRFFDELPHRYHQHAPQPQAIEVSQSLHVHNTSTTPHDSLPNTLHHHHQTRLPRPTTRPSHPSTFSNTSATRAPPYATPSTPASGSW
jgi:hypothetical protein